MMDESDIIPGQYIDTEKDAISPNMQKIEVSDKTKERVDQEIKTITAFLKESMIKDGPYKGLLPYIEKDGTTRYRSEDLGYALRVAVNAGDQELFKGLFDGVKALKISEGLGKGLFRASIDQNGNSNKDDGTAWADGDQDIALALIEGGLKWGDQTALSEGKDAAEAFINSTHNTRVGKDIGLTATLAEDQGNKTGNRIRTINLSMYNFKLYEVMQQLDPGNMQWKKLHESGLALMEQSMAKFKLPPDRFYAVDSGSTFFSDSEMYAKLDANSKDFDQQLADSIDPEWLQKVRSAPPEVFRALWSSDALRIPYRLTDSQDAKAHELAQIILGRIEETGGIRKRALADTGESVDETNEKPGFVVAPFARTIMERSGDPDAAVSEVIDNIGDWEKSRIYNQSWVGMGLSQITASSTEIAKPRRESMPIKLVDRESDEAYLAKVLPAIDQLKDQGGDIVYFDVDGTIISQDKGNNNLPYVRQSFDQAYRYAKEKGMRVGILTLRSKEAGEINDVQDQDGYQFDEVIGADVMNNVIEDNPRQLTDPSLRQKSPDEILGMINSVADTIAKGEVADSQLQTDLLQVAGEYGVTRWKNPKLLYLAHRVGGKYLLVDDDAFVGAIGEKLGVVSHIPAPAGHVYDK